MLGKKIKLSLISASLVCSSLSADLIINSEVNSQQSFDGESESALITENGFINITDDVGLLPIINYDTNLNSPYTFKNRGKIHAVSTSSWITGVTIDINDSTVSNDGEIDISAYTDASGIRTSNNSSANINNSGLIKVNSSTNSSKGVYASSNSGTINNSGTIIARKNMQRDYDAYSIYINYTSTGSINNTGTLDGNINAPGQTLTNSGNIILPYNANGANAAYISNFTNKANGVLQVYLQANSGGTMEHSELETETATFEDGSSIKVNVLGLSSDIELLVGNTMTNVVYSNTSNIDIQGTLNITDNS
ncbi:hypothetical protein, partial [Halarcobacter sp.]|uniref:hypothetical protein n=1 Tax=Halarcobacter sp. TaxID=2321133 RepID=UPI003A906B48